VLVAKVPCVTYSSHPRDRLWILRLPAWIHKLLIPLHSLFILSFPLFPSKRIQPLRVGVSLDVPSVGVLIVWMLELCTNTRLINPLDEIVCVVNGAQQNGSMSNCTIGNAGNFQSANVKHEFWNQCVQQFLSYAFFPSVHKHVGANSVNVNHKSRVVKHIHPLSRYTFCGIFVRVKVALNVRCEFINWFIVPTRRYHKLVVFQIHHDRKLFIFRVIAFIPNPHALAIVPHRFVNFFIGRT
jgi:hypothetical protein